ncbi:hypothetical protein GAY31_11410 [Azospirillum brasilense]|nr:hypothetical protein [Azospirillum brasilense]
MARKPLQDEEICALIDGHIQESTGYNSSKLSQERANALEYYDGSLPKPATKQTSRYVSNDVYHSVESQKAQLLETFAAGSHVVRFAPTGPEDVEPARIATEYVSFIVFRQNPGYEIFHDVIHDGLIGRNAIIKVWFDRATEEAVYTFTDQPAEWLTALLNDPKVELVGDPEITGTALGLDGVPTSLLSGEYKVVTDTSQVRIAVVPPEEFFISKRARSIETAALVGHQQERTLSELRAAGYDADKLDDIENTMKERLDNAPETLARFKDTDDGWAGKAAERSTVIVQECYARFDRDGMGERLWKVTKVHNTILDVEPADRAPFFTYAPLRRPHSFWGSSFAERIIPTQNARTTLVRGVLDHTVLTSNPRYLVAKGGLANPRELMENRFGGIINVNSLESVQPLPQSSLNPFVFQTIAALDDDREQTTGISRLSQGLNKEAISSQNSQGLVEQLMTAGAQRAKIMARNFAEGFLKPLWLEIYRLVIENEPASRIIGVAGNFVEISPQDWQSRKDVEVEFALGYGERDREAQKWIQVHQMLGNDPVLGSMYQPKNKREVARRAMEAMGIKDIDAILVQPEQIPPPAPDPLQQLTVQQIQVTIDIQRRQQELAEAKLQLAARQAEVEAEIERLKIEAGITAQQERNAVDRAKFEHKAAMDVAELHEAKNADTTTGTFAVS